MSSSAAADEGGSGGKSTVATDADDECGGVGVVMEFDSYAPSRWDARRDRNDLRRVAFHDCNAASWS